VITEFETVVVIVVVAVLVVVAVVVEVTVVGHSITSSGCEGIIIPCSVR
jgi:competence protein ComGC